MKILIFFITLFCLMMSSENVTAQGYQRQMQTPSFFMPKQELEPKYEKLQPIHKNDQAQNINIQDIQYSVKYVLVDGVYVPTYTPISKQTSAQDNLSIENHPSIKDDDELIIATSNPITEEITSVNEPIVPKIKETTKTDVSPKPQSNQSNTLIDLPFDIDTQTNVPPYRNIYAQYLQDTLIFQKKGYFPENLNLDNALQKMSSDKKIIVYKGVVKPAFNK